MMTDNSVFNQGSTPGLGVQPFKMNSGLAGLEEDMNFT